MTLDLDAIRERAEATENAWWRADVLLLVGRIQEQQEWIDRVAEASTDAATAAEKAEGRIQELEANQERVRSFKKDNGILANANLELRSQVTKAEAELADQKHLLSDCQRGRKAAQDEAFVRGDERDRLVLQNEACGNALVEAEAERDKEQHRAEIAEIALEDVRAERDTLREAARPLWEFLENERETFDPPSELREQGYVAVETAADYDKLERLTIALGAALTRGAGE